MNWYLNINGKETGPHSTDDLQAQYRSGAIPLQALVRYETMEPGRWVTFETSGLADSMFGHNGPDRAKGLVYRTRNGNVLTHYLDGFRNYFNFDGRSTRAEYWSFTIINTLLISILTLMGENENSAFFGILAVGVRIASGFPQWAIAVRRAHDRGVSGWFLLVPLYNFYLMISRGDFEANAYGPAPNSRSP